VSAQEGARAPDPFTPKPIGWVLVVSGRLHDFRDLESCAEALALCHARGDTSVRARARTSVTRYRDLTAEEQLALTMKAAAFVLAGAVR
jgi:hypothetical protein